MNKKVLNPAFSRLTVFSCFLLLLGGFNVAGITADAGEPNEPPRNPFLADSLSPIIHGDPGQTDYTPLPGPTGPTRQLGKDELPWKAVGPVNAWEASYSAEYPNGKQVIWTGGYDRVMKFDYDTFETLDIIRFEWPGHRFYTDADVEEFIAKTDRLQGQERHDHVYEHIGPIIDTAPGLYRLIDSNNDLYMLVGPPGQGAQVGQQYLRVYGDSVAGDPSSPIELKREWALPKEIAPNTRAFSLNMTYDGWIVLVTSSGIVFAVSRDLTEYHHLKLPGAGEVQKDVFTSFVRNGLAVDDDGGIYVVSRENMHRIQWTGKGLSLDEKDGGWTVAYPSNTPRGSGVTPTIMGWGDEDKLVIIADGNQRSGLLAYWRDEIPADWEGMPGQPRRLAGNVPVDFGNPDEPNIRTENSPVVWGYGTVIANAVPPKEVPGQRNVVATDLAGYFDILKPEHTPYGAMKAEWDPEKREFHQAWVNGDMSFGNSVCTVSGGTSMVYCFGIRNQAWTLEGVDWETGKSSFHYKLGSTTRYNHFGGLLHVLPNGAIDCTCSGGFGLLRIAPKN